MKDFPEFATPKETPPKSFLLKRNSSKDERMIDVPFLTSQRFAEQ